LLIAYILWIACSMHENAKDLPRFTKLDAFDPHRKSFECRYEAHANPPVTLENDTLFLEGMAATSYELWPGERDHAKAARLWQQAADMGHWKAQFNLAGLYLRGLGVERNPGKALLLTEDLMRKGVPAAWENMGTYYMGGVGTLKQDATVAYAFWQKAADMGSMAAQAYLGEKLLGTHDEPPSFWGNRAIGLKMLECAFAQGSGMAAFELGLTLDNTNHEHARALRILHEGVRLGSEKSAVYLASSFRHGDALVGRLRDDARAERYSILGNALSLNPDLTLPNLDKILPLPPAQLPKWDGDKSTLIDAARGLLRQPDIQPTPGAGRTGRAHIPEGYILAREYITPTEAYNQRSEAHNVLAEYENTAAPRNGYWLAQMLRPSTGAHRRWDRAQVPIRMAHGELFPRDRAAMGLQPDDGRIMWHYLGQPFKRPEPGIHPAIGQGVARYSRLPEPVLRVSGHLPCPRTGVWNAQLDEDHPLAPVFSHWASQAYVHEGQSFTSPRQELLGIEAHEVTWRWLDNANVTGFASFAHVSLSDLHDEQGQPLA